MNSSLAVMVVSALAFTTCAHAAQRAATDKSGAAYPVKPIRVMVPQAPGGSNDTMARYIGGHLAERLGMQAVVDNRAGAGGLIATQVVAPARPDGCPLRMAST